MEEKKFVCKYCNKKYPCGKSLGGHIKTHMTSQRYSSIQSKEGRRTNADDRVVKFDGGRKRKRDFGSEEEEEEEAASGNPIYGLRENPKKTTRFVHSNVVVAQQQERLCKECGKGFLSLKALCGHMACHSEKDKGMLMTETTSKFESNSGFSMKQKLVVDSQSDTETSAPNHHRRSRRTRLKTVNADNKNDHRPSFVSLANGSSSVSEVEQEQEEIAMCLMLLSKDSSHRGRFVLRTESSDNNSVVVEAKSPSVDTINTLNNGKKGSVSNGFEIVKEKKVVQYNNSMKLKSAEIVGSDNSDSRYVRKGPKKFDFSIDGCPSDGEIKATKAEFWSAFDFDECDDTTELRKKMLIKNRGTRTRNTEPRKLILEDLNYNTEDEATKEEEFINWRKIPRYDSLCQNNSVSVPCKRTPNDFHNERSLNSESLNSEKIINGSQDSAEDESDDESSTDTDAYTAPRPHSSKAINGKKIIKFKKKLKSKRSFDHECPICNKKFKSGQALGGHKRSHFVGGSEDNNNTVVIKQAGPSLVPCLIDLNLPAPVDD